MGYKYIKMYSYKECNFKIYENKINSKMRYRAECDEIQTYSDDLDDLLKIKIPQKYTSCREFKL
ncbi:hypothetical protein [Clostridium botulinum]|uniref:hypothetical protein n=1 Tax=Clostridium botulinum TaxID=1491 RepID=UPI0009579CA9|nr:hypothetical protein [Clostridium botulinum]APU60768.1 hypothetical protein NPD8_2727 [Clostridium botulinum]